MKAIVTFYHNLKRDGIDITHDGQRLNVTINNSALKGNPYIKDEIRKRANLLAQLLDLSNVPEELHEHIMRPLDKGLAETVLYICKCTGHLVRPHQIGHDIYLEYMQ